MRILVEWIIALIYLQCSSEAISLGGISKSLSRVGKNFGRAVGKLNELENIAAATGYGATGLDIYWQSNTLVAFSQMKRGEVEEAMETFNLAIATLAVWDFGQGIALPIADKRVSKIILKYKNDFRNTLRAFDNFRGIMKTNVLESTTEGSDALKGKLFDAKGKIGAAFQTDVTNGMWKFQSTQIYADLVTDLKGVKLWAKAAKWADVFAGPLFDAANVAVSAWQLVEAIKENDAVEIASNALGMASGMVGLASFAVAALATAGTTIAAVAGPVGAIVGAILGIASVLVEVIASLNPYKQIEQDIQLIRDLTTNSKKLLDVDKEKLKEMVPSQSNFTFSWIYEMNQGLALEYVKGRDEENYVPVKFRRELAPREVDGYLVVGKNKIFDKGRYPGNLFWNPQGLVNLGYDFYGKKMTENFNGATVIAGTSLVAGKSGLVLKGLDIVTYSSQSENYGDCVVIDDMYDMSENHIIQVKTGGGNDVIAINGLIGKPGHPKFKPVFGMKIIANMLSERTVNPMKKEMNVLSFEGMSTKTRYEYGIKGVHFDLQAGAVWYRKESGGSVTKLRWGSIDGVKMFVGSPFDDIVELSMDHDSVVRQTKGRNEYIIKTTSWGPFAITIDDQCKIPGKITIKKGHTFAGTVENSHLVYSESTRTLYIYGRQQGKRWQIRGTVFFNRRLEGYPIVRTEADGMEQPLNKYPSFFEADGETDHLSNPAKGVDYYFDRNLRSSACEPYRIYLNPPEFERGRYFMTFNMRKNTADLLIMKQDFVNKCLKRGKRSLVLFKVGESFRNHWILKLKAEDGGDSIECPGKDFEVDINGLPFEQLVEERPYGRTRVVVDIRRNHRYVIDVKREMQRLDYREAYRFNRDFPGTAGVSESLVLRIPENQDPNSAREYIIGMRGGTKEEHNTLVFSEELRNWAKSNRRKLMFKKVNSGLWRLEISYGWKVTHNIYIRNVEWIDFEPFDKSFRQPIILDLDAETARSFDLEDRTNKALQHNVGGWPDGSNDCQRMTGRKKRENKST